MVGRLRKISVGLDGLPSLDDESTNAKIGSLLL